MGYEGGKLFYPNGEEHIFDLADVPTIEKKLRYRLAAGLPLVSGLTSYAFYSFPSCLIRK